METIKKIKQMIDEGVLRHEDAVKYFPELKESEGERIRKELIDFLEYYRLNNVLDSKTISLLTDSVAWLEKKGKENPLKGTLGDVFDDLQFGLDPSPKQGEQILANSAKTCKVEPKFKVGDWVILTAGELSSTLKIVGIDSKKKKYYFDDYSFLPIVDEDVLSLWTIQDAKDGDVLVFESGVGLGNWYCIFKSLEDKESMTVHCYISMNGEFKIKKELCFDKDPSGVNPATKEQRDLLFQKMKEEGYEWDSEKKELKKIEQKPILDVEIPFGAKDSELEEVSYSIPNGYHAEIEDNKVVIKKGEQKTAEWSEEDEKYLKLAIDYFQTLGNSFLTSWLKSLKDRVQPQPRQEWSEEDDNCICKIINWLDVCKAYNQDSKSIKEISEHIQWLKSLRPQKHWKPSDEQMVALESIFAKHGAYNDDLLSLISDLKKLKA